MTRKESKEILQQMLDIYQGILFQNRSFEPGNPAEIIYDFSCPEFHELRAKYNLAAVAGSGSDFARAKRLLHNLAPRLTHSPWYDNHIPCNAMDLLAYSLDNPDQGINCLNKSKILVECCLAVGIYARRVSIMPFSPYDFDNHVVTEIFDRELNKWIMLDMTTDGYFIDETKKPLSLLEMRQKFANAEFITYVRSTDSLKDIEKLREKYLQNNMYICKNLFYFQIEKHATFGEKGEFLLCAPLHYSVLESRRANAEYRIKNLPGEYGDFRKTMEERLEQLRNAAEPDKTDVRSMEKKPE